MGRIHLVLLCALASGCVDPDSPEGLQAQWEADSAKYVGFDCRRVSSDETDDCRRVNRLANPPIQPESDYVRDMRRLEAERLNAVVVQQRQAEQQAQIQADSLAAVAAARAPFVLRRGSSL